MSLLKTFSDCGRSNNNRNMKATMHNLTSEIISEEFNIIGCNKVENDFENNEECYALLVDRIKSKTFFLPLLKKFVFVPTKNINLGHKNTANQTSTSKY